VPRVTYAMDYRPKTSFSMSYASRKVIFPGDGNFIPARYSEFVDVFSKTKAETLAPHFPIDHAIDLEPGCKVPYEQIYNISEVQLRTLKEYIETNLANAFIQWSSSSSAALILFVKQKDVGLRLCMDCQRPNSATVNN